MRRAEMIATLVFFLLGAHVVQQASLLSYTEKYGPGPGFFPFWLGWAWMGLALFHFANIVMQPRLYPGKQPFPTGRSAGRVVSVYAILLASTFLMGALGVLIALAAMALAILRGIERVRWTSTVAVAVVVSGACYLLFQVVLGVPFPKSPLGI